MRHNNIFLTDTYLPYSIFLAQPFYASVSKGAASTIFLHLWYGAAGIQTHNLPLRKRTLYQRSYLGGIICSGHLTFKNIKSCKLKLFFRLFFFLVQSYKFINPSDYQMSTSANSEDPDEMLYDAAFQ